MKKSIAIVLIVLVIVEGIALAICGTLLFSKTFVNGNEEESEFVEDTLENKETETEKKMVAIANPVAGMSAAEALEIANGLGEGKDMGTWSTMSAEEFLEWWHECN